MKSIQAPALTILTFLLVAGCDKSSPDTAKQLEALERKASEAEARRLELEQLLADERLAAEREAIERERMQIEEARGALAQQQEEAAAAEAENLRLREEAFAAREAALETRESALVQQQDQLVVIDQELSERDLELAGREALAPENAAWEDTPVADYGMFYDSLAAYGSWFETRDYGYVWQPVIVSNSHWRPYTRGRWVCSDYGWTWVSDEPFGWATYHYGRWALLRGIGWVWVPGGEWAPSWVSWRSSGSHIGWAPLPPETLAYRGRGWDSSVDVMFGISASWFSFIEIRDFGRPVHGLCLPYDRNHDFYRQTNNITRIHIKNHRVISGGPKYAELSRKLGKSLPFYRLEVDRRSRPGRDSLAMKSRIDGKLLRVSAPALDAPWNEGLKPQSVKRRLDSIDVERSASLEPEVAENFRRSRDDSRRAAEQSISELGGRDAFSKRRLEQLEQNRGQVARPARKGAAGSDPNESRIPQPIKPVDRISKAPVEPTPPEPGPIRQQQLKNAKQEQARQEQLENAKQEQARQAREQQELRQQEQARQQQAENAKREQARQAREQEELRQQEQARQQQVENAKREQARQAREQQELRQQEQARQQQAENAKREQARQAREQQELRQQEQARQQQAENAKREQERQARQQQELRQQDQARQQQMEAQRQQRDAEQSKESRKR